MRSRWMVLSAAIALASGMYSASAIGAADGGFATLLDTVQSTVGNLPLVGPTLGGAVGEVDGILNSTVIGTVGGLPVTVPDAGDLFDNDTATDGTPHNGLGLPPGVPLLLMPPP